LREVAIDIAKKEGYIIDPSAALLIAILGDGSFRDTLGMVQKVISTSADKKITAEEVETITGAPQRALIDAVILAIAEKNLDAGIAMVNKAAGNGINMKILTKLILAKLRFILLLRFAPAMDREIKEELDEDDFAFLKKINDSNAEAISSKTITAFLDAYALLDTAYVPQLPLELALIGLLGAEK
jgi:DNA polymerase III gamma/tau subunit